MYANAPYRRSVETEYGHVAQVVMDGGRIVATTDISCGRPISLTTQEAAELRDALDEAIFAQSLLFPGGQSIMSWLQLAERAS